METPGSLPDSHAAELDSTSLSPSRKLALGQEWRRPGDPPSYGPSAVEMDQVGCCRQVHARLPHPRLCECGTLAVGVPTEEPKSRKLGGGGVAPQGTRAPSGGGAGNDSGGQKASSSLESGPQSPFRRRTHLAWPLFHLSTQLSGPELISSGPGGFPFCRPSYIRRMEPQGVVGGTRLPCGELGGGDTGLFARLGRGGLRLARKDTVAFPQEPS